MLETYNMQKNPRSSKHVFNAWVNEAITKTFIDYSSTNQFSPPGLHFRRLRADSQQPVVVANICRIEVSTIVVRLLFGP